MGSWHEGWTNWIPGVGGYRAGKKALEGDWQGAARAGVSQDPATQTGFTAAADGVDNIKETFGGWGDSLGEAADKAWELLNRPYEDKKQGLIEIQNKIGQLKDERLGRKEDTYRRASAAYDPHRQAMQAVYGDPKQWKL